MSESHKVRMSYCLYFHKAIFSKAKDLQRIVIAQYLGLFSFSPAQSVTRNLQGLRSYSPVSRALLIFTCRGRELPLRQYHVVIAQYLGLFSFSPSPSKKLILTRLFKDTIQGIFLTLSHKRKSLAQFLISCIIMLK